MEEEYLLALQKFRMYGGMENQFNIERKRMWDSFKEERKQNKDHRYKRQINLYNAFLESMKACSIIVHLFKKDGDIVVRPTLADEVMVEEDLKKCLVTPPSSVLVVYGLDWNIPLFFPTDSVRANIAAFVKRCPTI